MSREIKNSGRQDYWRSLDQLNHAPEFRRFLEQEFPGDALEFDGALTRRRFLSLMGASLALAGLAGCRRPVEKIVPYVIPPEDIIPGIPSYYATTMPFGSSSYGLIVECHEGRPTKIEGNPRHPSTRGKSNAFMQAEILNLYDPDRSKKVLHNGAESNWDEFMVFWRDRFARYRENNGEGLAVLTEEFASPTLFRLASSLRRRFPKARFAVYEPAADGNSAGYFLDKSDADVRPEYHFDKARVILSLDSDFLMTDGESLDAAGKFADGRRIDGPESIMNRLYVVEPDLTVTGAMADHRLRLPRSKIGAFTAAIIRELERQGVNTQLADVVEASGKEHFDSEWVTVLARDLARHKGECLIVAGRTQPRLQLIVRVLNEALGNVRRTLDYYSQEATASSIADGGVSDVSRIAEAAGAGGVDTLIIFGGNPVYDCPQSVKPAEAFGKIDNVIHFSAHVNETSEKARWHIPRAHFLESWGDTRNLVGTLGVIQPMIQPLMGGIADTEFLNLVATGEVGQGYEIVRDTWREILGSMDFEKKWRRVLHDGVYSQGGQSRENYKVKLDRDNRKFIGGVLRAPESALGTANWELTFQISPAVYDGRYANNGWLQELPHPVTRLTWDNAACVSPKMAKELKVNNGDVVKVACGHGEAELPIWIAPGQADYTVSVTLGYGRTAAGRVGNGVGVNVFPLRPAVDSYFASGVIISGTGKTYRLASTQDHGSMEGRPIIREAGRDDYKKRPEFAREMVEHPPLAGIYPEHDYSKGYQWGMAIDLTICIGCNACTIACQSENNIPVVGKERVRDGREMHWMRIDRYFTGDIENPEMVFMPVACQHCENAPCEQVCPVAATVHDSEGLNVMTYNRCIGTRYCSNNCPYKVRRFNFYNYTKDRPEIVKMAMNPDVTIRSRGVMEKCTFCTQRINRAKIRAKQEGREVTDGEIVTACQQACPTDAILFGNINDPESRVSRMKKQSREYGLLNELNTRPRNSYLARIRNPDPDLLDGPSEG